MERLPRDDSGDELRELYRRYSGQLFGFACNALGDRGLAEEVVQDVFARAWRHAGDYDPGRASVRTWLFSIARNRVVDAHLLHLARLERPEHVAADELSVGGTAAHPATSISSMISRRLRSAYEVRLLTVPSGMPFRSAISRSVSPP